MHRSIMNLVLVFLCGLFVLGCSNGAGNPVTAPETPGDSVEQPPALTSQSELSMNEPETFLWGYYDLYFDIDDMKVEAVANRSGMFTANVTMFLNMNPARLGFKFNDITAGVGYVDVDVDISITHPLGLAKFNGYDVRGVFIGNGSGVMEYNGDLIHPVAGIEQVLSNADGYTRWFNPPEFQVSGLFGYTPGAYAAKGYTGTATLNPYKYFAEGLTATDDLWTYLNSGDPEVGYFLCATTNVRNYLLRFPIPLPGIKYGYAVIANWGGGAPEYHPSHATEAVGVDVVDSSTVYYVDEADKGGNLILDITVFDWDSELSAGVMEDYVVNIESTVLTAVHECNTAEMTPTDSGATWNTYHMVIPADNVTGLDGNEMWVIVECASADYTNPFAIPNSADADALAACFRFPLTVATEPPPWIEVTIPNGGEIFVPGTSEEITWTSEDVTGTVEVEYSKDNFVSDLHTIAAGEDNDGSYTWDPIPLDPSGAVRVRISSTDAPTVFDTSDADFEIAQPTITVTQPNGGEVWPMPGPDHEITWYTNDLVGNVNIDWSTDDFVSDINPIASDEANDGSYTWSLPCFADTALVRVSSVTFPSIQDVSDDYFKLGLTGWAEIWQTSDSDNFRDAATDSDGNTYAGGFIGDSDQNPILAKYSPCGELLWDHIWDNAGSQFGWKLDVDDWDNVYMCGYFAGTDVDFDPTAGIDLHSAGLWDDEDCFLTSFTPEGDYRYTLTWGSPDGYDACYGVGTEGPAYVYVTGYFEGTMDCDPGPGTYEMTSSGTGTDTHDCFVIKFDTAGNFVWAKHWGGEGDNEESEGLDICVDGLGGVYHLGSWEGVDVDFDSGAGTDEHTSAGAEDIFIIKYDIDGNYLWGVAMGSTGPDWASGLCIDNIGFGYFVGIFSGTVNFNPYGSDPFTSNGGYDVFLTKLTSSGTYSYTLTWGGSGYDEPLGIVTNGTDTLYICGAFSDTVDFDPDPVGTDNLVSAGNTDAFITKLYTHGYHDWARRWGGEYYDASYGVGLDPQQNVCVGGQLWGTDVEFAQTGPPCNDDSEIYSSIGIDGFVVKYLPDGCW